MKKALYADAAHLCAKSGKRSFQTSTLAISFILAQSFDTSEDHLSPPAGRGRRAAPGEGRASADFFKRDRARSLRQQSTEAERLLWNRLRSRSLHGHKFVRQQAIGPYFVDFICRRHHLIIELDGGQHAQSKRDGVRDAFLSQQGYRILRFWNNDVLANIEGVWDTIAAALPADSAPHPER